MSSADRQFLDDQLALLRTPFGLTDLPSQQESDDPIPTHILLNVAKKMNIELRREMQMSLSRESQQELLQKLDSLRARRHALPITPDDAVTSYPLTWPGAGDDESRERFAEVRKAAGETHKAVHDANKSLAQLKALHGALSPLISLTNTTAREKLADIPSEITRTHELVDKLASVGKGRRAGEEGYEPKRAAKGNDPTMVRSLFSLTDA